MTSAVNGLPETLGQRSDFPWRKGAQARRTEKIVVGLCLTQFPQQNPYRRVRPIGDEKYPLADDFETLSIRTFLVVWCVPGDGVAGKDAEQRSDVRSRRTRLIFFYMFWGPFCKVAGPISYCLVLLDLYVIFWTSFHLHR